MRATCFDINRDHRAGVGGKALPLLVIPTVGAVGQPHRALQEVGLGQWQQLHARAVVAAAAARRRRGA